MVKLNTTPTEVLEYYTPQKINELYASGGSGKPRAYTIIGGEIKFAPTLIAHIQQRLCIWKVCQICRIVTRQIRF